MSVEIEHFDPSAGHGRPRVASFLTPAGKLDVHCDRTDGSLWLFAQGPRGGERGRVAFPVSEAPRLLQWAEAGGACRFHRATGSLIVTHVEEGSATVVVGDRARRGWSARFDPAALTEFITCIREWAAAVVRVGAA